MVLELGMTRLSMQRPTEEGESNQRKVKGFIQRGLPGVRRERMGGFKRGAEMKTLRSHENASYDICRRR